MTMKQLGSVTTMSAKDQPSVTSVLPTENGALTQLIQKNENSRKVAKVNDPHQWTRVDFFSGIVDGSP